MEPEFNPLSPEKKLGTTINTRYRGAGVFISFIIRDPLLAWRITGWTRKWNDGARISGYFTDFLVFQGGRKWGSVVIYTYLAGKIYQSFPTPEIERIYLTTFALIKTKQNKRHPTANLESYILKAKSFKRNKHLEKDLLEDKHFGILKCRTPYALPVLHTMMEIAAPSASSWSILVHS